jgi:thioredoxin-related protein
MPVPISKYNFDAYGASTTPTLVLLDRTGKVALYHPGALPYDQLRAAIERVTAR